jgi:hypothetical protein
LQVAVFFRGMKVQGRGLRASGPLPPPLHPHPQSLEDVFKYSAKVGAQPPILAEPLKGWKGGVGGGQGATAPWPSPHLKSIILFAEQRE